MPALVLASFIRLLTCLIGSPPKEVCLKRVWQHVLVPKVNLLKFITRTRHDSTFSILDTQEFADTSPESECRPRVGVVVVYPTVLSSSFTLTIPRLPPPLHAVLSPECLSPSHGTDPSDLALYVEEEDEEEEDHFLLLLRPQITDPLTFEQITGIPQRTHRPRPNALP